MNPRETSGRASSKERAGAVRRQSPASRDRGRWAVVALAAALAGWAVWPDAEAPDTQGPSIRIVEAPRDEPARFTSRPAARGAPAPQAIEQAVLLATEVQPQASATFLLPDGRRAVIDQYEQLLPGYVLASIEPGAATLESADRRIRFAVGDRDGPEFAPLPTPPDREVVDEAV